MRTVASEELPAKLLYWSSKGMVFSQSSSVRTYDRWENTPDETNPLFFIVGSKRYDTTMEQIPDNGDGMKLFKTVDSISYTLPRNEAKALEVSFRVLPLCDNASIMVFFTAYSLYKKKTLYVGLIGKDSSDPDARIIEKPTELITMPDDVPVGVMALIQGARCKALQEAIKKGMQLYFAYSVSRSEMFLILKNHDDTSGVMFMPSRGMNKEVTVTTGDGLKHTFHKSLEVIHEYDVEGQFYVAGEDASDSDSASANLDETIKSLIAQIQVLPDNFTGPKESGKQLILAATAFKMIFGFFNNRYFMLVV